MPVFKSLVLTLILGANAFTSPVVITVDCGSTAQKWEGFGTTDLCGFDCLEHEPEANAPLEIPVEIRKKALELYYRDLGMNFVRFAPGSYEPANDNDDPSKINWDAFVWHCRGQRPLQGLDPMCDDHLVLARGFRDKRESFIFYPANNNYEGWLSKTPDGRWWFGKDGRFNEAMTDEYAEHALAAVLHVKQKYGYEIPFWSLFNEPTNTAQPSKETTLALVLACGKRFAENRLSTKLVICDDVTPEASAEAIEYVLADEMARKYVGAVSYHRYCGDFVLEQVKPMLAKVDKGDLLVSRPVSFHATAVKYGKSVWVSEQCSYGDQGITYSDTGRARANHIIDEINCGKVNSFNFMLHCFIERGRPGNEECPIFFQVKDGKAVDAHINTFGSWISHFTRYIRPGAVRIDTNTDNPLVKCVAFQHQNKRILTLVVVNNRREPVDVSVEMLKCPGMAGNVSVVRTDYRRERLEVPPVHIEDGVFRDTLPATSISTYVCRM